MIPRHFAAAQGGKANAPGFARASHTVAAAHGIGAQRNTAPGCRRFAEQQSRARGCVDLAAVVCFDNLDIPVLAKPAGGLAHQMGEQGDAQRGVAGLQHGDLVRGSIAQPVVAFLQTGGADNNWNARCHGRIEIGFQCLGAGEIDQNIARLGQRQRVAANVDAARMRLARCGNRFDQGAAHASLAADNSDARH